MACQRQITASIFDMFFDVFPLHNIGLYFNMKWVKLCLSVNAYDVNFYR